MKLTLDHSTRTVSSPGGRSAGVEVAEAAAERAVLGLVDDVGAERGGQVRSCRDHASAPGAVVRGVAGRAPARGYVSRKSPPSGRRHHRRHASRFRARHRGPRRRVPPRDRGPAGEPSPSADGPFRARLGRSGRSSRRNLACGSSVAPAAVVTFDSESSPRLTRGPRRARDRAVSPAKFPASSQEPLRNRRDDPAMRADPGPPRPARTSSSSTTRPPITELLSTALRYMGYEVTTARTGPAALEAARDAPPGPRRARRDAPRHRRLRGLPTAPRATATSCR